MPANTALYFSTRAMAATLIGATALMAGSAHAQSYAETYQNRVGDMAIFHTTGPATTQSGLRSDRDRDAFVESIEMPDGSTFTEYYHPVDIHFLTVQADAGKQISILGGADITVGLRGQTLLGDFVGDSGRTNYTSDDLEAFEIALRDTLANNNLNSLIDVGPSNPYFEFVIEFDLPLKDNDPDPDDFGELLYFERGFDGGNSWITIQAVDENGDALGPALAISPFETIHTTPPTNILPRRTDEYIGSVGIDISRLGVSETRYLKVRKTSRSDSGYYVVGNVLEDFNPDFKFMAVMTNPEHIAKRVAGYD